MSIGIIIRPIGAYIFGHLADRHGRKDALVGALVLTGGERRAEHEAVSGT